MDRNEQGLTARLRDPERHYVKAYIDFLDTPLLSLEEKVIFIILKRFLDFNKETGGEVYPSIEKICAITGASRPTVIKLTTALTKKGVIEKVQRGLNKTNAYLISDRASMWSAKNLEELKTYATETEEEWSIRILKEQGYIFDKERAVLRSEFDRTRDEYAEYDSLPDLEGDDGKEFEVRLRDPERIYVKVYIDFLDSGKLALKEIGIFILLKRFLDVRKDLNGTSGEVYPSLSSLSVRTGKTKKTLIGLIDNLVKKGVLQKKVRGLNKTNLYLITDRASMWRAGTYDEVKFMAEETSIQMAERKLREKGYTIYSGADTNDNKYAGNIYREPYSKNELEKYLEIDILKKNDKFLPSDIEMIDKCLDIIWETMNSTQKTYTIDGEQKPAEIVKSRLMKLNAESVIYAIDQYQNTTADIRKPTAYLRSILYRASFDAALAAENETSKKLKDDGYSINSIKNRY